MNTRYQTPVWSTAIYGALSVMWYVGLTIASANVLADSIAALGLTIAFYYGINGFAAPMLYRTPDLLERSRTSSCSRSSPSSGGSLFSGRSCSP